ncbi:MAG TPA: cytochrome c biogenesis protein CcsA [Anaeromyxobacteraceae bacterium]|nr:cytochrome c biogenesis protein CcsA [Anaeromyxobacteraceae bacterium]
MSIEILRVAAALYAAGAAAYIVFFARPRHARAAPVGFTLVLAGFVVHAVSIGLACRDFGGNEFFNLRGGFGMLGWLAAGGFLLLQRFYRMPSVGAFVLPLVLIAILPGVFGVGPDADMNAVPDVVRLPTLKLHVSAAIGGVAVFALAFGVALMYLLQEREVKGKHFGALFSRLPSLDALDRLNQRLVRFGFVVFTVALVTGSLVAKKQWGTFWDWDGQQIVSVVIWLLYGAMVQATHRGVHGRRYAVLTLVGFALVLSSMIGLRQAPGITKHKGDFKAETAATSGVDLR